MIGIDIMSKVSDNKGFNNNLLLYILFVVIITLTLILIFLNKKSNKVQSEYGSWLCSGTHNVKLELEFNRNSEFIYDDKTIKMLRLYYLIDIKSISELKISDNVINNIDRFINTYYDRYTGLYLKSKKFLNNINEMY